jgi:hypothetical protein
VLAKNGPCSLHLFIALRQEDEAELIFIMGGSSMVLVRFSSGIFKVLEICCMQVASGLLSEVRTQVGMLGHISDSTSGAQDMLKSSMVKFNKARHACRKHGHIVSVSSIAAFAYRIQY